VLRYNFFDEFRLLRLPQKLHEPFRILLIINRLNGVNSFLEYVGNMDAGEPILRAYGSGFSIYE